MMVLNLTNMFLGRIPAVEPPEGIGRKVMLLKIQPEHDEPDKGPKLWGVSEQRILDALDSGPKVVGQLVTITGMELSSIKKRLAVLLKEGDVDKVQKDRYVWYWYRTDKEKPDV